MSSIEVRLNGVGLVAKPRQLLSAVLSLPGYNIQYWSKDALLKFYRSAIGLVLEIIDGEKGVSCAAFRRMAVHRWEYLNKYAKYVGAREVIQLIYDEILAGEGLPKLFHERRM